MHRGRDLSGDLTLHADAVVVGTGAGGSIVLRELARAGAKVVGLEEGGVVTPADMSQREDEMLPLLMQDMGGRMTIDLSIRVLQGRGVGGSTLHNTNLCKRTPDEVLERWAARHRVSGAGPADLRPRFEAIERDLSVTPIAPASLNGNNAVLRDGARALGWRGGMLRHNRVGCVQSGFCELGCAYDAKQNAAKVVVPQALVAGAEVYADVHVDRVRLRAGEVVGLEGALLGAGGERRGAVSVSAPVVVLAGSAVGSAAVALASGLPDPHAQLGRGLRLHPGGVVAGRFDRDVHAARGIPQSFECTELLSFEEGSDRRVWILPAFAHPVGTATILSGFGAAHMEMMREYNHLAVLTAMVHDEASGRVTLDRDLRPSLDYALTPGDRDQLGRGLAACARLLFAAGAHEVMIPATAPLRLVRPADADRLDLRHADPRDFPLTAAHPAGTLRMGDDPTASVVGSTGEHHQVRGLFVADGSLFPTSVGVPPQLSVYALALHLAPHVIAATKR
jgi:choline dehydrogenase-like flavoprotein